MEKNLIADLNFTLESYPKPLFRLSDTKKYNILLDSVTSKLSI